MDQSLRQRISSAVASPSSRLGALAVSEISLPWTISRNRQKVLGFAAMAVSLVLISAPFVLNVDNDVMAKAQTVAVDAYPNTAEVTTEMATAEDVVAALNAARDRASAASVVPDTQLELGAQGWASNVAENGSIRTDRSLRALLNNRQAVGEFVVAAPSLSIAYQRLMANRVQEAQLLGSSLDTVGVGVQTAGGKTYLVIRFAS
jgi:uncharacterized protein YkwD